MADEQTDGADGDQQRDATQQAGQQRQAQRGDRPGEGGIRDGDTADTGQADYGSAGQDAANAASSEKGTTAENR